MSLQVWLPLNGDLRNQGLNNMTFSNTNTTNIVEDSNGKLGKCYKRTTKQTAGRIISNTTINLSADFSMCCWAKVTDCISSANGLVSNHSHADNTGFGITVREMSTTDYRISCNTGSGSDRTYNTYYGTSNIKDAWHHLAITYDKDNTQLKLWVDGICENTIIYNGVSKADYIILFDWSTTYDSYQYRPAVAMNDVRIYDHALSPLEVKRLAQGLVLHYPLNRGGFGAENIISGTSPNEIQYTYPSSGYSDKFSPITTIVPTASQYTLSFWAKSTVNGDKVTSHYYSPNTTTTCVSNQGISRTASDGNMIFTLSTDWEYYWVTYTQTETTAVKHVIFPRIAAVNNQYNLPCIGSGTISVKCVKFEEGSIPTPWIPNQADALYSQMGLDNNIEYDVSGYGNNLELVTESGTALPEYLSDTPRYNVCTKMNGVNQYLRCISPTTEAKAASLWVKTGYTGNAAIFTDPKSKLGFGLYNGYIIAACDGNTTTFVLSGFKYNQWNHIVVVKNDDNSRQLYINGVAQTVNTNKSDSWSDAHNYLVLFRRGYSNSTAIPDCMMSDFRLYATCLSAADVAELYNTPISLSNNGTLLTQGEYVES